METRGAIDAQTIIIKNANKAFAAERKKRAPAEKQRYIAMGVNKKNGKDIYMNRQGDAHENMRCITY